MDKLLSKQSLPMWFSYPKNFLRIFDQGLLNFDPWIILQGEDLHRRYLGLKERYPKRELLPFAAREDNDDVACWEHPDVNNIVIIHDYASSGWEDSGKYNSFWDWFRSAVDETIIYGDD